MSLSSPLLLIPLLDDIPDLSRKIVLITGGTSDVGKETPQYLLQHGSSHIIITGRNQYAAEGLIAGSKASNPTVQIDFTSCELINLEAVKSTSSSILSGIDGLDLVFCGAGNVCNAPVSSEDGYELQFPTNHLGHALLIEKLLPILRHSVRVLKTPQSMFFGTWRRYGQSKLTNIVYARALARRYPSIILGRPMGWFDILFVHIATICITQPTHEHAWNGVNPSLEDYRGDEQLEDRLWEWTGRELERWV
ncbi:hypothetical protein BDV97DRAFT_380877 [Delphinella strobiligena]|nr:hypothetical protein BDV97DRAFT_380877 [Delphinella strobiligena]